MSEYSKFKKMADKTLSDAKWDFDHHGVLGELVNAFGIGQVNTTLLAEMVVNENGLDESLLDGDIGDPLWMACIDAGQDFEERTGAPH